MTTRIKLRRDTAANWTSTNPILAAGEPGLETNTGKIKYGDGVSRWNAIEHTGGDALTNAGAITVQTGDADRWLVKLRREDNTFQPGVSNGIIVYSTNYDSQGNVIVLARVDLTDDTIAAFKFTAAGELVWRTVLDPEDNFYDEGHAAITPTGDVVFCLGNETANVTVIKLNGTTGVVTVSQQIDLGLYFNISSVTVDNTGNIIMVGLDEIEGNIERGLIVKLSSNAATIQWQTALLMNGESTPFNAVAVDVNNNIVVTGTSTVETPGGVNPTENAIVVAKFAGTDGGVIWQKTVALPEVRFGAGVGLSLDSVGNIYVCGALLVNNPITDTPFGSSSKSNAAVIFKMTSQGAMAWDRRVGPGSCDWVGVSTAVGEDDDLYLYAATYQRRANAGVRNSDGDYDQTLALARYNKTTGAVVWQKYFNNPNAQEIPGISQGPWGVGNANTLDVFEDRILIGGTTRLGPSDIDMFFGGEETNRYFTQGFIAQFDTDATKFSVDGWTLETSRIPGKLNTGLVATTGTMTASTPTHTVGTALTLTTLTAGISVSRTASKTNTWTFGKDGTFTAPADTNIKLQQTQLGYANMYGVWPNTSGDGIWFDSVTHDADGFAYAVGSDEWGDGYAHIYKFSPEGELVWQRQLYSGSGATFNVNWENNVYTEATVASGGNGYKVGDKIVLDGGEQGISGNGGVNSLTLSVATIANGNDGVGQVATVDIESGVASGTGSATNVRDFYDNAECEVRSMTFDPVTGNPIVVVSTPTYNGDTFDSEWTETVILHIDSGSGAVLKSTTLSDNGDIYPNDIAVSVTGKIAVVGEKYGEYQEYGAITPLGATTVDKLWVAKADIDAEHYPGEPNGNYWDWWITGTGITDQTQVTGVNNYTGLTTTVRQGSGAEFTVQVSPAPTRATIAVSDLATAGTSGSGILLNADNIVTPGGWTWLVFSDGALRATLESLFTNSQVVPVAWAAGSTSLTGFIMIQFPGDGTFQITPVDETGSAGIAGTWYFDLLLKGLASYSVLVTAGGTNYLPGHKVKVLGTALGGTSPANDCIIIVDGVNQGAITSVSNSGTPNAAAVGPYTGLTGVNHDIGSGALIWLNFNAATGVYENWGYNETGTNYVDGDLITISGTQFAGGAAPDNNFTFNVIGSGGITNIANPTGSVPSTHLLITTSASVDFVALGATFAIKQSLDGETFVWTPDWSKAMGGSNTDSFHGVVWNAAGTSLYAVGEGRYETTYNQALVTKWSSTGTIQASVSINANDSNDGADYGAVALMADDSIVTVHTMYNTVRDETTEVLVTKLDSNLQIIWQQFIGVWSDDDGWESPDGQPSVAVDPATDEILVVWEADADDTINDDAVYIVKLDTNGDVIWKRVFGVHESDTQLRNGTKFVSISGDKYTVVGTTDAPSNDENNAMIFTMPLDGTGVGYHGLWWYFEPNDDQVKVMRVDRESDAFTPNINSNVITATDNVKYYYTGYPNEEFDLFRQVIRSEVGGALEFADGSKQSFSTAVIPQVRISGGRYVIRSEDSGRHILVEDADYNIRIPNYREVALPVGFTFTIVNISDSTVNVENQYVDNGERGQMWFSGGDTQTPVVGINDNGSGQMVTLIKIKEGTYSDDGEQHGDIWMIAGADIYNND
jgi:hypothetical protein